MPQSIFIVDDEEANLRMLERVLTAAGYCVRMQTDVTVEEIEANAPDLLILDWMLKGCSGLDILARLRANPAFEHLPVMIMSGRDDDSSRVEGLRAGADDYLCKPMHIEELRLRIQGLLKRSVNGRRLYCDGHLRIDGNSRTLLVNGAPRSLGDLEWRLLCALLECTAAIPSGVLRTRLWARESHAQSRNALSMVVKRLRKVLDPDPDTHSYILATAEGYRFARAEDHTAAMAELVGEVERREWG
jgi:DNA-binding response OmpR family regulator